MDTYPRASCEISKLKISGRIRRSKSDYALGSDAGPGIGFPRFALRSSKAFSSSVKISLNLSGSFSLLADSQSACQSRFSVDILVALLPWTWAIGHSIVLQKAMMSGMRKQAGCQSWHSHRSFARRTSWEPQVCSPCAAPPGNFVLLEKFSKKSDGQNPLRFGI